MTINVPAEQSLVSLEEPRALELFKVEGGFDATLAEIRKRIDAWLKDGEPRDPATAEGRKSIRSMAFAVARSKTYLEEIGKKAADEAKALPKKIDANRRVVKDTLDEWRDEIRKPADEWEAAEEARVARHASAVEAMSDAARLPADCPSSDIRARIERVEAVTVGPECEEFLDNYARAQTSALATLREAMQRAEKAEADARELAELRRLQAERDEADRQERLRKEGEERARKAAEDAAAAELHRVEIEAQRARDAAAAAERRAQEAEERAKREAEEQIAAARAQAERQRQAEEAAAQQRAADREHRGRVNSAALAAFVEHDIDREAAMAVIKLIATNQIPAVSIQY